MVAADKVHAESMALGFVVSPSLLGAFLVGRTYAGSPDKRGSLCEDE